MTDSKPTLVLSSSSPARNALLKRLQIPFVRLSPDVDETPLPEENAETLVKRLAELKARVSAKIHTRALIIGCDQVGTIDGEILCKPLTHEKAVQQLRLVSGKKVRFLTGLCLFDARNNHCQLTVATYDVYFRHLSDADIQYYLQHEDALQCAGSFQAEGLGITLIEKFEGDDYTALIGLPLIQLTTMMKNIST